MADTNFVEINPTGANAENDATYQADSFVTGGAAAGPFPSALANKVFLQLSRMVAALAYALVQKGYSPVDGTTPFTAAGAPSAAVIALATILENIITNADLQNSVSPYGGAYFTGANLGSNSVATTPLQSDDSTKLATTHFVKEQNYVFGDTSGLRVQSGSGFGNSTISFPVAFSSTPNCVVCGIGGSANVASVNASSLTVNSSGGGWDYVAVGPA